MKLDGTLLISSAALLLTLGIAILGVSSHNASVPIAGDCPVTGAPGTCVTHVHEGKIYGFCSHECKENFINDPDKYVGQADEQDKDLLIEEVMAAGYQQLAP